MPHLLHFGAGPIHHSRTGHRSSPATRDSIILWVIFAVVVIAMVIASGVNALPSP
ncbi:hypothetical protein [Streptacidiphilus sp. MAP12-16]|uniref:hypothetical protein n=1 Tax=Streptacidiphilus sp. MAP12-16 TaxID=3156300 RepID=UPI003516CC88